MNTIGTDPAPDAPTESNLSLTPTESPEAAPGTPRHAQPLPSGTVTFVFTDIEGSTRLLQVLGDEEFGGVSSEHL